MPRESRKVTPPMSMTRSVRPGWASSSSLPRRRQSCSLAMSTSPVIVRIGWSSPRADSIEGGSYWALGTITDRVSSGAGFQPERLRDRRPELSKDCSADERFSLDGDDLIEPCQIEQL